MKTAKSVIIQLLTVISVFTLCVTLLFAIWIVVSQKTFMGYFLVLLCAPACCIGAVAAIIVGVRCKSLFAWVMAVGNLLCAVGVLFIPGHAS
jgi:hypothetical protein